MPTLGNLRERCAATRAPTYNDLYSNMENLVTSSRREAKRMSTMRRSAMRMSVAALALVVGASTAAWAADPPVPSGPHPRLFMRPADVAAYAARARSPDSAAAKQIARCQRTIDLPDEFKERGGVNGDTWPGATLACAFSYRVTGQKAHLAQALKYWRITLNDDQKAGDALGCTPAQAAKGWSSWKGDYPPPPALVTVTHDTWYPMRSYGPFIAVTYDWLYGEADEALRQQTRQCLTAWIDAYSKFGYLRDNPGANYHAGFAIAKTLGAIAIGTDGETDKHLWSETLREVFARDLVGKGMRGSAGGVGQPAGLMVGGDWGSWQYGPFSVLEYAVATRAVKDHGAPQPELEAWLRSVGIRSMYGMLPKRDLQFTGNGDYEGEGAYAVYPSLSANQFDAVLVGPSSDQVAAWAAFVVRDRKLGGFNFWNALAEARNVAPEDYRAQKPAPPLWYLARGVGDLYVRTSWGEDALWAVFMSGSPKADHAHFAAGNFVWSRGGDHLIVDSSNYGQFSTRGTNAVSADTSAPEAYAGTQGPWGMPSMPWLRATTDRVFAARSDFAKSFEYNGLPSDIKYAHRDWVMLPEGEIVVIDRVLTESATRNMYLTFHANTAGTLALDAARGVAVGKVGSSRLAIHRVKLSGGAPKVVKTAQGGCPGDCRFPCGSCTAVRYDVDVYSVVVPGPFAVGVHVFDALGETEAPAAVASINDDAVDPAPRQNAAVLGASVLRAGRQSYVVASSATRGATPAAMSYGVPGGSAGRHVVFDAPEAKDGTSAVTAAAKAGRCVVGIAAGSGGGTAGRPLVFDVASATDGCTVKASADAPGAVPLPARGEVADEPDDEAGAPASRQGLRGWLHRLRGMMLLVALVLALPIAAFGIVARRRRGRAKAS